MHGGRKVASVAYQVRGRAWQTRDQQVKALSARVSTLDVNTSKGFKWRSDMVRSGFRKSPVGGRVRDQERRSEAHPAGGAGEKQRGKQSQASVQMMTEAVGG